MYNDSDMWIKEFFTFKIATMPRIISCKIETRMPGSVGTQMLLGGTDEWVQSVAAHLKFWLINGVFHFHGQGDNSQLIGG